MVDNFVIHFFNKNGDRTDVVRFPVDWDNETLTDKLEEVLYITQELTPASRDWKQDFVACDKVCLFTYHNMQDVKVELQPNHIITVIDC